jgi:hypothetical protein
MIAVIPSKSNRITPRQCDFFAYKERHLIECFFGKIKHYRRIFARYEKKLKITWALLESCHLLSGIVEMSTEPKENLILFFQDFTHTRWKQVLH